MKEKRVKEIVVVGSNYTAQGYFYMVIKDSHIIDQVIVKFKKYYEPIAEALVVYLKLNGWQENEDSRQKVKEERSKCTKCNSQYTGKVERCNKCSSPCSDDSFVYQAVILEKIGALTAHQEDTMTRKENRNIFQYIESNKNTQKIADLIILSRWE